jgi:hypothetical protein
MQLLSVHDQPSWGAHHYASGYVCRAKQEMEPGLQESAVGIYAAELAKVKAASHTAVMRKSNHLAALRDSSNTRGPHTRDVTGFSDSSMSRCLPVRRCMSRAWHHRTPLTRTLYSVSCTDQFSGLTWQSLV